MAKQNGLVRLLGTVGDITYYRSKDGFLAKEKTSLSGTRIATDPKFKRTRENMAEFGEAGRSGKALRDSISILLQNARDSKLVPRLCRTMMQVIKTDTAGKRGKRKVAAGDVTLLSGFEFNANAILNTTFFAPYSAAVDRQSGALSITIPPFIPASNIVAPEGATHFKFVSSGMALDFNKQYAVSASTETALLPWDSNNTAQVKLTNNITAGSSLPLFLVLGIQFYQEVNGDQYPLANGSFNALSVIEVDKV